MKLTHYLFSFLLFAILFSGSCTSWSPEEGVYQDTAHADELKKAPESIGVAGMDLSISCDLWINRMPKTGKEPPALTGVIILRTDDGFEMLESTSIRQVFVMKDNTIWVASPVRKPNDLPDTRTANISNGPEWAEDTTVDVVCKFEVEGRPHFVQQKGVKIHAVY